MPPPKRKPEWVRMKFGYKPRKDPKAAAEGGAIFDLLREKSDLEGRLRFETDPKRIAELNARLVALGVRDA